jgi:excinuclease ABC subunit A
MDNTIQIIGARQHNLKNVSLSLPKNTLIVFTGVSGSGKSSLAMDTIYAEGQRRYVESLSSYARQFLGVMDKPDVDNIIGLSPSIAIDQKSTSHNPRSTVGTVTEVYDYLRLLFARIGHPHCPNCNREISKSSVQQIVRMVVDKAVHSIKESSRHTGHFMILAPVVRDRKGEFTGLIENIQKKGYRKLRIDNIMYDISEDIYLIKTNKHTIDVVIDKFSFDQKMLRDDKLKDALYLRLADAIEQATALTGGYVTLGEIQDKGFSIPDKPKNIQTTIYSEHFSCPHCLISISEIEPRMFSFNSPHGACPTCTGIGTVLTVDPTLLISEELSINEGGILPFSRLFLHDTWYSRVIAAVCATHAIDPQLPIQKLSSKAKHILLYGTGDTQYEVTGTNRFGKMTTIYETFGGVIAELKRRHRETQSEFVRYEIQKYMREEICSLCHGTRLKKESLNITIDTFSISDITGLSVVTCKTWLEGLLKTSPVLLSHEELTIANPIIKEIVTRLQFLIDVGLIYLTLSRSASSLSGGEAQRIRLASQIGSGLSGVLYVLDEPSIGLHQRDNKKLIHTLQHLKDLGNTVIVVEHDREMMESADTIVDFGPGAGEHGGNIIAQGNYRKILASDTLTAKYLSNKKKIIRTIKTEPPAGILTLVGARHHNLKNCTVQIPLGKLVCVTGVSGSGKSSLIVDTVYRLLQKHFNSQAKDKPGECDTITGIEHLDKVILIDQDPIGRTPRSNPATYTGVFTYIRELYALLPESKSRGYTSGRFSFNVKGGRCETCEGEGQKRIEMQFLSDVFVTCEACKGTRYNDETLEILFHGKTIADILAMSVDESVDFFKNHYHILGKLKTVQDVGLGYIKLGQPATMLSGGEAQRIKLASELSRKATGKTMYVLDEPTTGLHFSDLEKLLHVLDRLTESGNTVVVIEHNLDIIKNADWIIDMGPEGGDNGGEILGVGTPKEICALSRSYTGKYLHGLI